MRAEPSLKLRHTDLWNDGGRTSQGSKSSVKILRSHQIRSHPLNLVLARKLGFLSIDTMSHNNRSMMKEPFSAAVSKVLS